jgi:SNF2 family DNA or RNA helicase
VAILAYNSQLKVLELTFRFDPKKNAQAKAIYGCRWSKRRKVWEFPATVETARAIVKVFDPGMGPGFEEWWARAIAAQRAADRANALITGKADLVGDYHFHFRSEPYQHQRDYCEWGATRDLAGLTFRAQFSEQGTGKTKSEIDMTVWEIERGICNGAPLIFCPNSVKRNWEQEFYLHAPLGLFQPVTLKGSADEKIATLDALSKIAGKAGLVPVVIVNYEVLSQPSQREVFTALQRLAQEGTFGKVIFDESTMIKNVYSNRGKNAFLLAKDIPVRVAMTGTPYSKAMTDIFNQMRCLDASILGTSWPAFRKHHVILGGYQNKEVIGYVHEDELETQVNRHAFRRLLSECGDMPDEIELRRACDMSKDQVQATRDLKQRYLAELETEDGHTWVVNATQAMTRLLRFNQIASGFLETDLPDTPQAGKIVRFDPNPKLDLLMDILEQEIPEDQKVVIWCCFRADVREILRECQRRGIGAVPFYGDLDTETRHQNEDAFKHDPSVRAIVAIPKAGGFGLNWQAACNCIFYSYNFSWEEQEQAKARIRRITQQNRMTFFWLVAENPVTRQASHGASTGINQYILENLNETSEMAQFMTGDFRKLGGVSPRDIFRRALEVL